MQTLERQLIVLANQMRKQIGAQYKMIGKGVKHEIYADAQAKSDDAIAFAKYLITHLENRHLAVVFAHAVGMPGYINLR